MSVSVPSERKFAYDVWGDTVNIAARMEAASEPNRVLASAVTVKGLGSDYSFEGPHRIDPRKAACWRRSS